MERPSVNLVVLGSGRLLGLDTKFRKIDEQLGFPPLGTEIVLVFSTGVQNVNFWSSHFVGEILESMRRLNFMRLVKLVILGLHDGTVHVYLRNIGQT